MKRICSILLFISIVLSISSIAYADNWKEYSATCTNLLDSLIDDWWKNDEYRAVLATMIAADFNTEKPDVYKPYMSGMRITYITKIGTNKNTIYMYYILASDGLLVLRYYPRTGEAEYTTSEALSRDDLVAAISLIHDDYCKLTVDDLTNAQNTVNTLIS